MTGFDAEVILWLNYYSQKDPNFDGVVVVINRYHLVRGVVLVGLLWWAWTASHVRLMTQDLVLVRVVLGLVVAIAAGRGLQNMLPGSPRPVHDPELAFQVPLGFAGADALEGWNSFPSDHAVVTMALVVAILYLNRLIGLLALAWAIGIVLLPRIYLGLHYPSDIVGGAAVGAAIMAIATRVPLPAWLAPALARLEDCHRGLVYAGFFVFSYLCASMFSDVRDLLRLLEPLAQVARS
jgi:undecaprenyl-diphosphatase